MHGAVWVEPPTPEGLCKLSYDVSSSVQFGGAPGPNCGQRSMDLVLAAARRRVAASIREFELAGLLPMGPLRSEPREHGEPAELEGVCEYEVGSRYYVMCP